MEKLTTTETSIKETPKKSGLMWKTLTFALWVALSFSNMSCWKTTERDVMKQEKKVESLSLQISQYIKARKGFVKKYNDLLWYPKTEANKNAINESLLQLYEAITKYDEKIKDLAEDKIDAEVDLNKYRVDLGSWALPDNPIDPDKWDFLLTIQ